MPDEAAKQIMRKARAKYLKEKVESISFRVPIGQKEKIRTHATKMGESMNAFITRAVIEAVERDIAKEKK